MVSEKHLQRSSSKASGAKHTYSSATVQGPYTDNCLARLNTTNWTAALLYYLGIKYALRCCCSGYCVVNSGCCRAVCAFLRLSTACGHQLTSPSPVYYVIVTRCGTYNVTVCCQCDAIVIVLLRFCLVSPLFRYLQANGIHMCQILFSKRLLLVVKLDVLFLTNHTVQSPLQEKYLGTLPRHVKKNIDCLAGKCRCLAPPVYSLFSVLGNCPEDWTQPGSFCIRCSCTLL